MVAAAAGHPVLLYDAAAGAAQAGLARERAALEALVARGKLDAQAMNARLSRVHVAPSLEDLSSAGLVIEAIVENLDVKVDIFRKVEAVVAPSAILATNTSSLSVTALAGRLARPGRLGGLHFFNPPPILPLVEIVRSALSEPEVITTLYETARAWGKTPVLCASTPGFIVNRVARPYYAEALRLLGEQVADAATLDAVMRESGGFRMGPFELMDLIGHDVNFAVTRSVYEGLHDDPRYRPSIIQQELVHAGRLGRKTGRGFYDHARGAVRPEPRTEPMVEPPRRVTVEGDLGPAGRWSTSPKPVGLSWTGCQDRACCASGPARWR